ncbi:betaine reductase complex component B subunit beta [Alkalithermobacter paradoxus]|uniref:Betaine reductase complex component B subunit beta n=3 Tax=Alkalithermobacter paradoxus TaxID=29349 RepID=A0A1V4I4P0_9FIRM|nr:betaine reductase complex component B subunit beta [[Clostridium] thermoalcaliphilum]
MKKAILYLNQFFGQIGGEELADHAPEIREGLVGPAIELNKQLGDDIQVTHTIICGDNFMGSRQEEAINTILGFLEGKEFDIFFAGPAFRAGRYGSACGNICKAVKEKFNVPVISSMNDENPGVEMFRKDVYIFKGGASAAAMRSDIRKMAQFGKKLLRGEDILSAEEEGYYSTGSRHQKWLNPAVPATDRVIDMLLKKIRGEAFKTELPIPESDLVPIAPAIKNLADCKIALATTGGIVPVENPDRIQSASATRWGKYDITGLDSLQAGVYKTIHAGFDPAAADANPNVIVPLDVLRVYEREGRIGSIHNFFYTTVGTGTTQGEAARMGKEMVEDMKAAGVDAVILTST